MSKEILLTLDVDERRAAVYEDGELVEYSVERLSGPRVAGNLYLGRVENVLPGMQAAFVNIGLDKNAFLYVDEATPLGPDADPDEVIEPDAGDGSASGIETEPGRASRRPRRARRAGPPLRIEHLVRPGQEILVQVAKEPMGSKGARITRHITLPGRFIVLAPQSDYVGVSRRIAAEQERERLRAIAQSLRQGSNGIIVRTAAQDAAEDELRRDAEFLQRLWSRIQQRAAKASAPSLIHRDLGLALRVVRDQLTADVDRLVVDDEADHERILELLDSEPALVRRVERFPGPAGTLFDARGVDAELERALRRRIWLRSGATIVIDQTEALTVIDVNTGKFTGSTSLGDTVYRVNLEACQEIARQLRLRDIGGIVVVDFIDMESDAQRQGVVEALKAALARDRTRTTVLGFTQLGLLELTRKKVRQNLDDSLMRTCFTCHGSGRIPSEESIARRVRSELRQTLRGHPEEAALVETSPGVASLVIGPLGANLRELERQVGKTLFVRGSDQVGWNEMRIVRTGRRAEVEAEARPVRRGQVLRVQIAERHAKQEADGIARVAGFVIDVQDAASLVGQTVEVEITEVHRTFARARCVRSADHVSM